MQLAQGVVASSGLLLMVLPAHTDLSYTVGNGHDGKFTDATRRQVLLVLWDARLGPAAAGEHPSSDPLVASWSTVQAGPNVDLTVTLKRAVSGWGVGIAPGVGEIGITFDCST